MLQGLGDDDVVMRMGLEDRLHELVAEIAAADAVYPDGAASTALFFGGLPVIGSLGVESEFGSKALGLYQDLVSKQYASDYVGLGQRGIVPAKSATRLHITNVVRGSFGFVLEELDNQAGLVDSSLKLSVDHVADIISAFGEDDEDRFEAAIEDIDERVLSTVRDFFAHMRQAGATFRIVNGDKDRSFSSGLIDRAERRANITTVTDGEEQLSGTFLAALPEAHQLEFQTNTDRGVIRARIDRSMSAAGVLELNRLWMEKPAVGHFAVRQVAKNGRIVRESFKLLRVEAAPE